MQQKNRLGACLLGMALALVLSAPASAQDTFQVGGTASDLEGNPLQYTVIGIPELETWALSDENGRWVLQNVQAGQFRFVAIKRGYYYADTFVNFQGEVLLDIQLEPEAEDNRVERGRLLGTVFDQESGRTVRDAEVLIEPMNTTVTTNRRGQFDVPDLTIGALQVTTSRLGYRTRVDTLAALPGVTLSVRIQLVPEALELEPIEVTAEIRNRFLEGQGFYRRQTRGQGFQLAGEELQEEFRRRNALSVVDVFNTVPGVRRDRGQFGGTVLTSTRDGCELTTYWNGMRSPGMDLEMFLPEQVLAVEVYRGAQVPAEFSDPCGVVIIWSV